MSDLITVTMGALQTEFDNEVVRAVRNVGIYVDKEKLIEALQLAESLVRCKDCKYRCMDGDVTHYYWCRLHDRPVDDTDYCAWGEERSEG